MLLIQHHHHSPADVHVRPAGESKRALGVAVSLYFSFFLMDLEVILY